MLCLVVGHQVIGISCHMLPSLNKVSLIVIRVGYGALKTQIVHVCYTQDISPLALLHLKNMPKTGEYFPYYWYCRTIHTKISATWFLLYFVMILWI